MDTSKQEVPNALRRWLVFHFFVSCDRLLSILLQYEIV